MVQMIVVFLVFCVLEYLLKSWIAKKGGKRRK